MNTGSLVPANTKRSTLILGMFRLVPDVVIATSGTAVTVFMLAVFSNSGTLALLMCLIPMLICVVLVLPIPNYHNTLCAIQSILGFYQGRRKYIWRGWCVLNESNQNK